MAGSSPPKDEEAFKKWIDRLADGLKRLAGKVAEPLPAIAGSVVAAILSFLGKAVRFVAKHTWALIALVAGLVGWWLMQKVKKSVNFSSACHINELDISLIIYIRHKSYQGHENLTRRRRGV